jgi:hypothetical protein
MKKPKIDIYNQAKIRFARLPMRAQNALRSGKYQIQWWNVDRKKWNTIPIRVSHPFGDMEIYRAVPPKKVFIHVRGGVAYCGRVPKGVEVTIIDHDNEGHQ